MSDRTVTWLVMFAVFAGVCAGALLQKAIVENGPEAIASMALGFMATYLVGICAYYVARVWIKKSQAQRSEMKRRWHNE